jgi:radical SAM superfamily enzyme YgiQ (UPF0313 family)
VAKYVLVADTTLSNEYRDFPLLDFLPCVPTSIIPSPFYRYLKGKPPPAVDGRASRSCYPIRKIEAALLKENTEDEVVVPHDDHIEEFIGPETEVIGINTMDPFGIGPLTMSFPIFFGIENHPYVTREFEALAARINRARAGTKAKLLLGGPGVWECMVLPEEMDRLGIDYAFQGEADDIACVLFKEVSEGSLSNNLFFKGFQTFDDNFKKYWAVSEKLLTRSRYSRQFPKLEDIPEIRHPSIRGLAEVMRGCGIGCDFCEVTLRPLRYYPPEKVTKEVAVNANGGHTNAWLHSDEIFAYEHGRNFEPNSDALSALFSATMAVLGIESANPTHGRISIPCAYPELIRKISNIVRASPARWVGIQVGLETGSERLAKIHMPNKTLPLRIGADGNWPDIVWRGVHNLNQFYWRPAFTVQVGQADETAEDNWETVALINSMSDSSVKGRPFEFSVTPVQNVPLGLMKGKGYTRLTLEKSQLAVYYASYRHVAKEAIRNLGGSYNWKRVTQIGVGGLVAFGGWLTYSYFKHICKKRGLDTDSVDRISMKQGR